MVLDGLARPSAIRALMDGPRGIDLGQTAAEAELGTPRISMVVVVETLAAGNQRDETDVVAVLSKFL
jgi:hypothetical protein